MSERRKVGPSALTGGLLADAEQAERDRLPPAELAPLLAGYRRGDQEAGKRLQQALRYIPYAFFMDVRPTAKLAAEDVLGTLFSEFGILIGRLRNNQVAAEDVEGYIRSDLAHSITHFMGECSQRIRPKGSTNSERKRRGKEPYRGLSRVAAADRPSNHDSEGDESVTTSRLEDPRRPEVIPPNGKPRRTSLCDDDEPHYASELWAVARSPIEEEFVELIARGHDLNTIADILDIGRRRVREIRRRLHDRLRRAEDGG